MPKFKKTVRLPASILASVICSLLSSCATDQAAKMRSSRPVTVGAWGAAYRPSAKAGVVSDLNGAVSSTNRSSTLNSEKDNTTSTTADKSYETSTRSYDVGLHFYPWDKSAFFYGLGASYMNRTMSYSSQTISSSLTDQLYTQVSLNDKIYGAGPSIGWDWICENGFSVFTDLGSRIAVSKKRSYLDDGATDGVNTQSRDDKQAKIDKEASGSLLLSARMIVGYSF